LHKGITPPVAIAIGLVAATLIGCAAGGTDTGDSDAGATAGRGSDAAPRTDSSNSPDSCAPRSGDPALLRLRGTVWTGHTLIPDGEVMTSAKTGKILCVSANCDATPDADKATVVCTNGVITPGFVNPHDHANYNHLPRWQHSKRYSNRYQWQADQNYKDFKKSQGTTFGKAKCETMKWAELRALVGGTTAMQGTSGGACINGWVRDLDEGAAASGITGFHIDTQVGKISGASASAVKGWINGLKSGTSSAAVIHLGEGVDASSRDEWDALAGLGLGLPGVSLIHAAGLQSKQLAEARQAGVRIIWSPQSNLDLYGATTRVPAARNMGITVALGPDWTPSGSLNQLDEMRCAKKLSDKRWNGALDDETLLKMVTVDAAASVGAADFLGRLGTGYLADIAVFSGSRAQPYATVRQARPETVRLVVVGGRPLYGDAALLSDLLAPGCEPFDACGVAKKLCVKDAAVPGGDQDFAALKAHLEATLAGAKQKDAPPPQFDYAYELWPLFFCGDKADALVQCDVGGANVVEPGPGDLDGDTVPNDKDVCPQVWDPDQGDLDSDALGDACDACPRVPGVPNPCPQPSAGDSDGDSVPNATDNCPTYANTGQLDADKDGKGDACDPCPIGANPGDAPCPSRFVSVTQLNDPIGGVNVGEYVTVAGVVVTATVAGSAPAVWAQAVPGVPWGGIKVLLKAGQPSVKAGDTVSVTGTVGKVFGLRTVEQATIQVKGESRTVEPLPVPITTLAETSTALPYRSLLVEINNAVVSDANPDAPDDFGEIEFDGGLRCDDMFFKWSTSFPRPKAGDKWLTVRGIMTYTYGAEKLLPRTTVDFAK
jgi:hypothetical protein